MGPSWGHISRNAAHVDALIYQRPRSSH
jgi:hypothetical protein